MADPRPLIRTARGTNRQAFGPTEWGLLVFVAGVWGSSFLLIAIGLEDFAPGVVTFGRNDTERIDVALTSFGGDGPDLAVRYEALGCDEAFDDAVCARPTVSRTEGLRRVTWWPPGRKAVADVRP